MPDLLSEITDAARAYYRQANEFPITATDWCAWLAELSGARRAQVVARGRAASRAKPDFLRYCLAWRGLAMRAFMAQHRSVAAFELWLVGVLRVEF